MSEHQVPNDEAIKQLAKSLEAQTTQSADQTALQAQIKVLEAQLQQKQRPTHRRRFWLIGILVSLIVVIGGGTWSVVQKNAVQRRHAEALISGKRFSATAYPIADGNVTEDLLFRNGKFYDVLQKITSDGSKTSMALAEGTYDIDAANKRINLTYTKRGKLYANVHDGRYERLSATPFPKTMQLFQKNGTYLYGQGTIRGTDGGAEYQHPNSDAGVWQKYAAVKKQLAQMQPVE